MIAEPLLNAVLHLFGLQTAALPAPLRPAARQRVQAYLHDHVGLSNADPYTGLFDDLVEVHAATPAEAILDFAAPIGGRLKALLSGFERSTVLLHFFGVAALAPKEELPVRLTLAIGETLGFSTASLHDILGFVTDPASFSLTCQNCRRLGGLANQTFRGKLSALRLEGEELFLVAGVGEEIVRLEGLTLSPGRCLPLGPDQVLLDSQGNELYFSDVLAAFDQEKKARSSVVFEGHHLSFTYPGSDNGVHDFSFNECGGRLIAIMGNSGSGKSTLLSILNGTLRPDSGKLLLNGHDVYADPSVSEGVFGFVPQADLLVDDLTVFENLYYAGRLCRADLPEPLLIERVRDLLTELGQAETSNRKAGSSVESEKTISGGQRKRLNIALELIREPAILFVDEPTSGLSSSDAEMVIRLLRQQTARGRLVFVVIHQPSSKIFRMFDAFWMLDQGGWPVFCGTPIEAITYFRSRAGLPGAEEGICRSCGSVHPEQIFEIVEGRLLDSSGHATQERKITPQAWAQSYQEYNQTRKTALESNPEPSIPKGHLARPGRFGQIMVYLAREIRARLSNRSYMAVTLLEPPLLALLLGLLSRGWLKSGYSFHDNDYISQFFFMSVIVALFLGLSVSAEEICRDAKIRERERFLHLSWWSYVNAKALYLAAAAGLQMLCYLAVALPLVDVPGLFLESWVLLFACALCASLLGLNVSATFKSAVTIYILIPLLLLPQMLLSGVIITYDHLLSPKALCRNVPAYASILPSRWAYEAWVVEQYTGNAYTRLILEADEQEKLAEDDLDFYLPELRSKVRSIQIMRDQGLPEAQREEQLVILKRELTLIAKETGIPLSVKAGAWHEKMFDTATANQLDEYLSQIRQQTFARRQEAAEQKRTIHARLEALLGATDLESFKRKHTNRFITQTVLNLKTLEPIGQTPEGLFRRTLPIYRVPVSRWGGAPFLSRHKRVGPWLAPAYDFNLAAILILSLLLHLALGFRVLPRCGDFAARAWKLISRRSTHPRRGASEGEQS